MKEYILCSAIWFDDGEDTYNHQPINIKTGYVVCGQRHHNCFNTKAILQGVKTERNTIDDVQGFLTNKNRFVGREEAAIIAFNANQIKKEKQTLYSEDLY